MLISPPVPETQLFKKSTLKIQGQCHGWGQSSQLQCESNILSTNIHFVPCQLALPFLRYSIFKIWPWKSRVKVKWPWRCTRKFHSTSNGINPSSGFRDMVPQSLDPICGKFHKLLAHGQSHMGLMGKWPWQCTTTGQETIPQNFEWRKSIKRLQNYDSTSLAAARPAGPWKQYPSSPEGWGVKTYNVHQWNKSILGL